VEGLFEEEKNSSDNGCLKNQEIVDILVREVFIQTPFSSLKIPVHVEALCLK